MNKDNIMKKQLIIASIIASGLLFNTAIASTSSSDIKFTLKNGTTYDDLGVKANGKKLDVCFTFIIATSCSYSVPSKTTSLTIYNDLTGKDATTVAISSANNNGNLNCVPGTYNSAITTCTWESK